MPPASNITAPGFSAQTTEGPIRFLDWLCDNRCALFSHPEDLTPACTTELGSCAQPPIGVLRVPPPVALPEFGRRL